MMPTGATAAPFRRAGGGEERHLQHKSKLLWEHLNRTEQRANELRRETERLRRIKDEAKKMVVKHHPNLFSPSNDPYAPTLSESSDLVGGPSQSLLVNKELREIHELLRSQQEHNRYEKQLRNFREKVKRRQQEDAAAAGADMDPNVTAFPREYIQVPVETLQRLLASSTAVHSASDDVLNVGQDQRRQSNAAPRDLGEVVRRVNMAAVAGRADGGGSGGGGGDDTSNDAADLSQENEKPVAAPYAPRSQSRRRPLDLNGGHGHQHSPPPPPSITKPPAPPPPASAVTTTASSSTSSPQFLVQPSAIDTFAKETQAARTPTLSSNEPDENFVIESTALDEKLYSSATDDEDEDEDDNEVDSSMEERHKNQNEHYDAQARARSRSSESSSDIKYAGAVPKKPAIGAHPVSAAPAPAPAPAPAVQQPPSKLKLFASDTDESLVPAAVAAPKKNDFVDELSGPELDDDDFWN